jgi:hypothetical protein
MSDQNRVLTLAVTISSVLMVFLGISASSYAEVMPASITRANQGALQGTAWEGHFTTPGGLSSAIRLIFLPELNARGELQYFHRLMGRVAAEVLEADAACRFTPRALAVQPDSEWAGRISIFSCVDDEDIEMQLELEPQRESTASIEVSEISLSPDGNSLRIRAFLKGITLTYELQRHPMACDSISRQELRAWLQQ